MRDVYFGYWIWVPGGEPRDEDGIRAVLRGAGLAQAEARGRGARFRQWLDADQGLAVRPLRRDDDRSAFEFLGQPAELVKSGAAGGVTAEVASRFAAADWALQVKYQGRRPAGDAHLWPVNQATSALARAFDGLVTRVLDDRAWCPEPFDLELAYRDRPRLTSFVTIHGWWLDRDEGLLELHTHGMEGFGLEDLVIAEIDAELAAAGSGLLNELAARLATGGLLVPGAVELPGVPLRARLQPGVHVECMPDAAGIGVELDGGDLASWWRARQEGAAGVAAGDPALLLQADMADRVARTRPTLERLAAWCSELAFAHDERAEVWAAVDPGDGEAWHWLELAGVGPAAWRGLVREETGERPVDIDPDRIARWHIRRGALRQR